MLSGALLSAVLGMHLPGPGAIFLSCQMRFLKPTRIGDTITAAAEVTEIRDDKPIITLRVWCTNQQGETTVDGEAVCYYGG
jgi:3-hydroxybutyryl-CoA dehydratase